MTVVGDLDEHDPMLEWMSTRVENIHEHVGAADVLAYHGVGLKRDGEREEQISCPFHGEDKRPSARYFPDDGDSRSHVWCFACHKRWDAIGLWIEFNGKEKFSKSLFEIEKAFSLTTPNAPRGKKEVEDHFKEPYERLLEACENVLRSNQDSFDMQSHLRLGHLVDVVSFAVSSGGLSHEEGVNRLNKLFEKMIEKIQGS